MRHGHVGTSLLCLMIVTLIASAGLTGCGNGGGSTGTDSQQPVSGQDYAAARESLVDFIITGLIIPTEEDYDVFGDNKPQKQIVTLYTDESAKASRKDEDADLVTEKIIVIEGGERREISQQEYDQLTKVTDYDFSDQDLEADYEFISTDYPYSFHTIKIYKLDPASGKANVEVGNTFGPLWGYGTLYRLELNAEGGWEVKSEQNTWIS